MLRYLSIYLSIGQSISRSIDPSIHPSIYQSIHTSIHPSVHLSIHPSIYLEKSWWTLWVISFFRLDVVDVNFPSVISNKKLKEDLKQQILAGRYSSDELVVRQKFTKIKIVDEKIEIEEFVVQGRKIALSEIRKYLLEKHKKFLRIQIDQYYNNITQEEVIGELKRIKLVCWQFS